MRHLFFLIILLGFGLASALPAHAQAFGDARSFVPATFGDKNPQLKAILALQYQLQILRRMLEREKAVNAMVASAVDIGIGDPLIPKPDRTLCLQIPANIPCAQAYKNLYPDYSVEPNLMARQDNQPPAIPELASNELPPLPSAELIIPVAGATLYWTNVTCLSDVCSAVITPDPADPRARYRVIMGEKLADGATVTKISAQGVTLEQDNVPVILEPAPKA